ncbi:MAG: ATP-binding domain-containing protein, partial [Methylocystis sp.]
IQVLCPMQRGALGARSLNADLQKALNPNPPAKIEKFGSIFAPGDKIMQTENDYDRDVFNGDLGTVLRIDEVEGLLVAGFDGREVEYPFGELDTVVPAYATTIHKSQGSEYPAVVITLAVYGLRSDQPRPACFDIIGSNTHPVPDFDSRA